MLRRWIVRIGVVLVHLALLAGLWRSHPAGWPSEAPPRLSAVRLLPPERPRPAPAPPLAEPRPTHLPALPALPSLVPPPEFTVEAAAPPAPRPAEAPVPAALPAEPPRTTLRLALPPGYAASTAAARNPALSDPRSNTGRPTLEDRIAAVTGGAGAWVEENVPENRAEAVGAQGDHRSVFRRGDTCVEVFRSRITDVDPFNGNVAPRTVKMLGKPYKCK